MIDLTCLIVGESVGLSPPCTWTKEGYKKYFFLIKKKLGSDTDLKRSLCVLKLPDMMWKLVEELVFFLVWRICGRFF